MGNPNAPPTTHAPRPPPRTGPGPGGTTTGSQACAACKHQRRRCIPNCQLAPYFPAHNQREFLNAHKLFGVSNIVKVLESVQPFEKKFAMQSIISHANVRANDPVGGYYRIICELQRLIDQTKAELGLVLNQLAICRAQAMQNPNPNPNLVVGDLDVDPVSVYNNSMEMDIYRRSGCDRFVHEQKPPLYGSQDLVFGRERNGRIKVDMGAAFSSSSSMVINGKQCMVVSGNQVEDVKPLLFGSFECKERNRVELKEEDELVEDEEEEEDNHLKDALLAELACQ